MSVTVRLSPEEQYRMTWGTGGIGMIRNPDFLARRGGFWTERLSAWKEPEFHGDLAPVDYGLVVVDFVTQRILSYQHYTALSKHHVVVFNRFPNDMANALSMIEGGRVRGVRTERPWKVMEYTGEAAPGVHVYGEQPLSAFGGTSKEQFEGILSQYEAWRKIDFSPGPWTPASASAPLPSAPECFLMDYSPFRLDEGEGTADELCRAKTLLTSEMGFSLTAQEEILWSEHISQLRESEEAAD
ncbi:hypothetical protein IQ289_31670 [Burkholderia sp. R-70006]|uniref:hypothetical protein n=1 Tax=Paraburkholderia domus TaxID=2793075 RepID=UPI0019132169|nr:hypothetical protein [Paraburkholderia domus]MBK5052945.1 hypothetical protein [Burkholderia sp. R-70006]